MANNRRPPIPKKVREEVLREYDHRCAVCGTDRPHIHHIDEDPSNNAVRNLIPLCPNCHLLDQHNPTKSVEQNRLQLFRDRKDPLILCTRFEPVFRRAKFLYGLEEAFAVDDVLAQSNELVRFVGSLNMGEYYGGQIAALLAQPDSCCVMFSSDTPEWQFAAWAAKDRLAYKTSVLHHREEIFRLLVEMLRYQDWPPVKSRRKNQSM